MTRYLAFTVVTMSL